MTVSRYAINVLIMKRAITLQVNAENPTNTKKIPQKQSIPQVIMVRFAVSLTV